MRHFLLSHRIQLHSVSITKSISPLFYLRDPQLLIPFTNPFCSSFSVTESPPAPLSCFAGTECCMTSVSAPFFLHLLLSHIVLSYCTFFSVTRSFLALSLSRRPPTVYSYSPLTYIKGLLPLAPQLLIDYIHVLLIESYHLSSKTAVLFP